MGLWKSEAFNSLKETCFRCKQQDSLTAGWCQERDAFGGGAFWGLRVPGPPLGSRLAALASAGWEAASPAIPSRHIPGPQNAHLHLRAEDGGLPSAASNLISTPVWWRLCKNPETRGSESFRGGERVLGEGLP